MQLIRNYSCQSIPAPNSIIINVLHYQMGIHNVNIILLGTQWNFINSSIIPKRDVTSTNSEFETSFQVTHNLHDRLPSIGCLILGFHIKNRDSLQIHSWKNLHLKFIMMMQQVTNMFPKKSNVSFPSSTNAKANTRLMLSNSTLPIHPMS